MNRTLQKEATYACTYPKQLNDLVTSSKIWNDIAKVSNWDQWNKMRHDLYSNMNGFWLGVHKEGLCSGLYETINNM